MLRMVSSCIWRVVDVDFMATDWPSVLVWALGCRNIFLNKGKISGWTIIRTYLCLSPRTQLRSAIEAHYLHPAQPINNQPKHSQVRQQAWLQCLQLIPNHSHTATNTQLLFFFFLVFSCNLLFVDARNIDNYQPHSLSTYIQRTKDLNEKHYKCQYGFTAN